MRQLIVLLVVIAVTSAIDDRDVKYKAKSRSKRQEDQWSSAPAENGNTKSKRQVVPESVCDIYNPSVPDFTATGRRKCEVKCYEYIWGIKNRNDQEKRTSDCQNYLKKNGTLPPFKTAVVGGHITLPGEYPHMGAIGWKAATGTWVFKCGGTLISEKFVLTAGHCSQASPRDTSIADVVPKIVRLGDRNIIDISYNNLGPVDANIIRVIVHPKYKPPKKYYDIALLELQNKVKFNQFVQPACLWPRKDLNGIQSASVTGWGVVETAGRTTSPDLQAASVDLLSSQECDKLLRPHCNRHWCGITEEQLCAGKLSGGVDACQMTFGCGEIAKEDNSLFKCPKGDSGGPLQVKLPLPANQKATMHTVVGVTSFGVGCALPDLPGIYTRVSSFVGWIEGIVWP